MAENIENNGCSQRDNEEHEGYQRDSWKAVQNILRRG